MARHEATDAIIVSSPQELPRFLDLTYRDLLTDHPNWTADAAVEFYNANQADPDDGIPHADDITDIHEAYLQDYVASLIAFSETLSEEDLIDDMLEQADGDYLRQTEPNSPSPEHAILELNLNPLETADSGEEESDDRLSDGRLANSQRT